MNVSLPKLAATAMPAKALPGAATIFTKFSTALAEARDTTDVPAPDVLNDGKNHSARKSSARGDNSNSKPSAAQSDSTLRQATTAAQEAKPPLINMTQPSAQLALPTALSPDDDPDAPGAQLSPANSVPAFGSEFALAGSSILGAAAETKSSSGAQSHPIVSGQVEPRNTDTSAAANQLAVSSTNVFSALTAQEQDTNSRFLTAPATSEPTDASNGKAATSESKSASTDATNGRTSALDINSGFTFLQSPASSSTTPVSLRPGSSRDQQERAIASASAEAKKFETHKKDFDGVEETVPHSKGNSSLAGTAPASNGNAQAGAASATATPGAAGFSASSAIAQARDVSRFAGSSNALSHGQSPSGSQATEATAEVTELSAISPLHAARLAAGVAQSELHVGLRAGEFGNVDIRTSLVRNQLTAEISVERGELGRALAAELPGLQHRLTEHQLPAATVTVHNHFAGSSEFQQESRQGHSALPAGVSVTPEQEDVALPVLPVEAIEAARLDIHM
ncbi:MAG TPA: hypothetical protein VKR57_01200 [Terriglobales bacterium]|nr:hypothetical protein [Terriglobales bacterium]